MQSPYKLATQLSTRHGLELLSYVDTHEVTMVAIHLNEGNECVSIESYFFETSKFDPCVSFFGDLFNDYSLPCDFRFSSSSSTLRIPVQSHFCYHIVFFLLCEPYPIPLSFLFLL